MSQPLLMKTSRETRAMAGEPPATIRVNNIQAFYEGPQDAWGRPDRPQPVSASVEVFLAKPFSLSSSQDVIEADTVHYGQLSKVIIALLDPSQIEPEDHPSLVSVVYKLWSGLSGIPFLDDISGTPNTGFLKAGSFRYLSVSLKLPKASLVGDGVSITYSAYMRDDLQGHPYSAMAVMSSVLKIHDLRVPTLIGINANERQARQTVIANIEIDNWLVYEDVYCSIEAVVVKVMEESSFGTLESLLYAIASKITLHLQRNHPSQAESGWRLRISLEKPIAVPFADAPCVELSIHTSEIRVDTE